MSAFLQYIPPDSALSHELYPELSKWATTAKTNAILADLYDKLAEINANLLAIGSGRPAKKPKPYPRPEQQKPENEQHFGKGALPPDELRAWFEEQRRKNAGSSISDS